MLSQNLRICSQHKQQVTHICAQVQCPQRYLCPACTGQPHGQQHAYWILPLKTFLESQNLPKDNLPKLSEKVIEYFKSKQEILRQCSTRSLAMIDEDFATFDKLYATVSAQCRDATKKMINQQLYMQEFATFQNGLRELTERARAPTIPREWFPGVTELTGDQVERLVANNQDVNSFNESVARLSGKIKERLDVEPFYKVYPQKKELENKLQEVFKDFLTRFFEHFKSFLERFNAEAKFNEKMTKSLADLSKMLSSSVAPRDSLPPSASITSQARTDQSIINVDLFQSMLLARRTPIVHQTDLILPDNIHKAQKDVGPFKFDESVKQDQNVQLEDRSAVKLADGTIYLGQWDKKTQVQWGKGKALYPTGDFYEGFWVDGEPDLFGRFIRTKGFVYEGQVKKGKEQGKGVLIGPDGYQYVGYFDQGFRQGTGKETSPATGTYEGEFYKSRKHGKGVMNFNNGSRFEGSFFEGKLSSEGVFSWPNGEVYKGQFCKGKKHGKGTYNYQDGRTYEGDFCDDFPHGFGRIVEKDGGSFECFWNQGKPIGGTLVITDQQRMSFYWRDSVMQA